MSSTLAINTWFLSCGSFLLGVSRKGKIKGSKRTQDKRDNQEESIM